MRVTVLLLVLAPLLRAEDPGAAIDRAIQRSTGGGFWGCVLVARDGKLVLAKGYGFADYQGLPNTPDTLFEIASTTKQFTAAAILKLHMEGELKPTDTIDRFFMDIPRDKRRITIHHLLTHTSGISGRVGLPYASRVSRDQAVRHWLAAPLDSDPGDRFAYSNAGYALLAAIVEVASGRSFEDYSREKLFKPAKLVDTGFITDKHLDQKRMTARLGRVADATAADWHWGWGYRGMGGVVTTAHDMLRWDRALRGNDVLDENARQILYHAKLSGYACGWRVGTTSKGGRKVFHSGGVEGYACNYVRYLDEDVVIVVLSNGKTSPHGITKAIEEQLFPAPKVTVSIDVSGYTLSKYRAVVFEGTARWRVKKQGGSFDLILEDPKRKHAVITIRLPKPAFKKLLGDLERAILKKRGGKTGRNRMDAGAYLYPYQLEKGRLELTEGMELQVMSRYVGRGEGGERVVDERILLIATETSRRMWCMMAKLGIKDAKALRKSLLRPE